jgi:hypothetical protein
MRRAYWIGLALLLVVGGIAIGAGAYHAGYDHGLEASGRVHEVVRVVGHGYGFPFGLFVFPLFFVGLFLLLRGAAWRHRGGGPHRLEELHRRFHEESWGEGPSGPSAEPATG